MLRSTRGRGSREISATIREAMEQSARKGNRAWDAVGHLGADPTPEELLEYLINETKKAPPQLAAEPFVEN